MRELGIRSAMAAAGLAIGVAASRLGAHPKAEPVQILAEVVVIATIAVFFMTLGRFFIQNLRGHSSNG